MKLFGERVAMQQVEETVTGTLFVPDLHAKTFTIGKVVAVGDGKTKDGDKKMWVESGELVMFQLVGPQTVQAKFLVDGKPRMILNQGDLIARLTKPAITVDNINILGEWLLLDVDIPSKVGEIILPSKTTPNLESIRFRVRQVGEGVTLGVKVGDEVAVERGRCQPLEIEDHTMAYIHQSQVHGVIG